MNRAMYYIGLVLAILAIVGGIVSLIMGAGVIGLATAVLGYILMVLLDLADAYLEAHK